MRETSAGVQLQDHLAGDRRIGRNVLRAIAESGRKDIEVVGINDLGPVETNAHLLRFDSVHGRFPGTVTIEARPGEFLVHALTRAGADGLAGSEMDRRVRRFERGR